MSWTVLKPDYFCFEFKFYRFCIICVYAEFRIRDPDLNVVRPDADPRKGQILIQIRIEILLILNENRIRIHAKFESLPYMCTGCSKNITRFLYFDRFL